MRHMLSPPHDEVLDAARSALFDPDHGLPEPPVAPRAVPRLADARAGLRSDLNHHGLALANVAGPVSEDEFIALGRDLGELMPESAPEIQRNVTRDVILHLREAAHPESDDLAPFGRNELTLHTEGSRRPAHLQPRFLVLYCVEPGSGACAQTVLVSAAAVQAAISSQDIAVLRASREAVVPGTPTILRREPRRDVFSFRDLGDNVYEWETAYGRDDVEGALRRLLVTCYSARPAFMTRWRRGDLLVIDNHRWFHARTRAPGQQSQGPRRHLQRLRILARDVTS